MKNELIKIKDKIKVIIEGEEQLGNIISVANNFILVKKNDKYIMNNNQHRMGKTKIHIVLTFNDNGRKYIVYKWYGLHKQYWHYELISVTLFEMYLNGNQLMKVKK